MPGIFLPQQFVAEGADVGVWPTVNVIPHLLQRQETVADVGRKTRRRSFRLRGNLGSPIGIAGNIEALQLLVGRALAALKAERSDRFVREQPGEMGGDEALCVAPTGVGYG
ncbi:MAG: hypothetical protein R2706_04870 [Acidimicrobiales bacterium]